VTPRRWPVAELDPVQRLRALAAGMPYVTLRERLIEAPFDTVWAVAGDLVNGVPRFEHDVRRIEILAQEGERLRILASAGRLRRMRFDVVLRPGWCVMRSRLADIGMAAAPAGAGRTRFAHYEGSRWLGRPARGLFARFVERDLAKLARLVENGGEEA